MKYSYIIRIFIADILILTALRFVQLFYFTDYESGFFITEGKPAAFFIAGIMLVLLLLLGVATCFVRRHPKKPPAKNAVIGCCALLFAIGVIYEAFSFNAAAVVPDWIVTVYKTFALLAAAVLIWYAASAFKKDIPFYPLSSAIIVLFAFFRLVISFSSYSSLSNNVFTVVDIITLCAALVWTLYFAKVLCGIKRQQSCRIMLPVAAVTCCLIAINSLPIIIINFAGTALKSHLAANPFTTFAMGIFMIVFDYYMFSVKNLDSSSPHVKTMPKDSTTVSDNDFYM